MEYKKKWLEKIDELITKAIRVEASAAKTPPKEKWLVLSFDALSAEDFSQLKTLPNFAKLIKNAACSKQVRGVYPSLTYPSHASFVTGRHPRKHGIVANTKLQPTRKSPDWYWFHKEIHGKTLFSALEEKGLTVASILWPVTGRAPIRYNMPEIFSNRPWLSQMSVSLFSGSKRFQWQMDKRHGHLRKGLQQPQLDEFVHATALDTYRTYQPDVMFVHYTNLDTQKHECGTYATAVSDALKRLDQHLGDYLQLISEATETIQLLVFGDHASRNVHTVIRPNVILQKEGFLSVEASGKLHHCDFVFKSCDGSAYLYHDNLHRVSREVLRQELEIIERAIEKHNEHTQGIKTVKAGYEAGYDGADAHAQLMLEASEGFYFVDDYVGEVIETVPERPKENEKWMKACHGYHPELEGYESVCFFFGKAIDAKDLGAVSLMDMGVTIAKEMGVELGQTDGNVLNLKK